MPSTGTQDFFAHIQRHGLAKANRFEVVIPLPEKVGNRTATTDDTTTIFDNPVVKSVIRILTGAGEGEVVRGLNTMCSLSSVPGKSFSTSETKTVGDYIKPAYGNVYEDISTTFLMSSDYFEKNIVDIWMNTIVNPETTEPAYFDEYTVNITIRQLDPQDRIVHEIVLMDAYPLSSSSIDNDNTSTDSTHNLEVTWAYRKWVNVSAEPPSPYDVTALSQTPLGPIIEPFMSNPGVQKAMRFVEETTGLDVEGEGVNIYNQINDIVLNTTGQTINKSVTLLENKKIETYANRLVTNDNKSTLVNYTDNIIGKMKTGE